MAQEWHENGMRMAQEWHKSAMNGATSCITAVRQLELKLTKSRSRDDITRQNACDHTHVTKHIHIYKQFYLLHPTYSSPLILHPLLSHLLISTFSIRWLMY